MAFAQTTLTSGAGITARITFYQLEQASYVNPNPGWPHAVSSPGMVAMISAFGEGVGFAFEVTGDGLTGNAILLRETTTSLAMPPVTDTDTMAAGGFVWPATPGPTNTATWSGPDEVTDDLAFAKSTGVWKMRDSEPMPTYANGPTDPCHLQHLGMKYTLGGETTSSVSTSIVSNTTGPATVTPSWAADGGGTRDLGAVTVALGMSAGPSHSLSGAVIVVDEVTYNGEAVSFEGYDESSHGMRCLGSGGSLTLSITDWTSVSSYMFSASVLAPIIIDYDIEAYDWGAAGSAKFRIPANAPNDDGEYFEVVDSTFAERRVYWACSWRPELQRPFDIAITLDADWAAEAGEDVDPSDLPCVIEESGLDCNPETTFDAITVGREESLNLLTSVWDADAHLSVDVDELTLAATVTVGVGAADEAIGYDLSTEYYDRLDAPTTLPDDYLDLMPTLGNWNLEQYTCLRVAYTAEQPVALTVTVDYSEVTVSDNHLTGSTRIEEFSYTRTQKHATFEVDLAAAATETEELIDLCVPESYWLQHVDRIALGGFANAGEDDWEFVLTALEAVPWTPASTTGPDAGFLAAKVVFPRPDAEGLPISYTAITMHADGGRACRPPDQVRSLCGEQGIDFVEELIGAETGTILSYMRGLVQMMNVVAMQAGLIVGGRDEAVYGEAAYDALFVDADGNDMLGGALYAGDFVEQYDREMDQAGTVWPVRPRVGRLYPCSGVPLPCVVRKHLHGSLHGMARGAGRQRAGSGVEVKLLGDGTEVATCETDAWSGYHFIDQPGVLELSSACIQIVGGAKSATYADLRNQLRRWVEIPPTDGCRRVAMTDEQGDGRRMLAYETGDPGAYIIESYLGLSRRTAARIRLGDLTGRCPDLVWEPDGAVVCAFAVEGSPAAIAAVRGYNGAWETPVTLIEGRDCPALAGSPLGGLFNLACIDPDTATLYAYQVHRTRTSIVLVVGSEVVVDTGVDTVAPSLTQECDGRLHLAYAKAGNIEHLWSRDRGATWEGES